LSEPIVCGLALAALALTVRGPMGYKSGPLASEAVGAIAFTGKAAWAPAAIRETFSW